MRKYLIGIGLVLIAVHNPRQPFLSYAFLPWIGIMLLVGSVASVSFKDYRKAGLGSKWVWIPLLILCLSITASGVAQYFRGEVDWQRGIAPLASALLWFTLYLVTRIEGDGIGKPGAIAVIIESVSIIVFAIMTNGVRGGGLVSPTNYDMATGFLVFGTFISPKKWQWWVSSIAIVGLFFTGAEEGMVALASIALVLLIVRDWSIKTMLPIATLIVALLMATPLGITHNLYLGKADITVAQSGEGFNPSTVDKVDAVKGAIQNVNNPPVFNEDMDVATGYRWSTHWRIRPIQPFGYGYNLTNFYWGIPHNIILIIIEQIGLIGLAAWLAVTAYCVKTSKRWYLWASFLALGMVDHYFFTQWAPAWFVAVGLSEAHRYSDSNIFRGGQIEVSR